MPSEALDAYIKRILAPSGHGKQRREESHQLAEGASESIIYGKTVERYLADVARMMEPSCEGKFRFGTLPHRARLIMAGIRFLCEAAIGTERRYQKFHPGIIDRDDFRAALSQLEDDVRQGIINKIPPQFWMTELEGKLQVETADGAFSSLDPEVQYVMAMLNYETFTGKTMLTGTACLERGLQDGLVFTQWDEKDPEQAQMPHLQLSNRAMRELVRAIVERTPADLLVQLIDLGSGTGATLAEAVLGLCDGADPVAGSQLARIHGIEGSPQFVWELQGEFSMHVRSLLDKTSASLYVDQFEIHEGNIPFVLEKLGLEVSNYASMTIVTANYVFHRLATPVKARIFKYLARHCENIIFLIADLKENASEVNRGYFNFRDNGLLNTGNIGLRKLLGSAGFSVFDLNQSTAPKTMNLALAKKIGQGPTSDAFFYVAYKGVRAEQIVRDW